MFPAGSSPAGSLDRYLMLRDQVVVQKTDRYKNCLAALDVSGVEFLVLDIHRDRGLLQAARLDPRWTVDFEDEEAVLFARVGATA
jgi:hypothetical protein